MPAIAVAELGPDAAHGAPTGTREAAPRGIAGAWKVPATIWSKDAASMVVAARPVRDDSAEPHGVDHDLVADARDQPRLLAHGREHVDRRAAG